MIEFSKINSFDAGQRESFEELICVLAKREAPENATTFQRIEGSGGDGGVEAIWNMEGGGKIGFQSKFFLKLESSQWSQIDKSVKRALEVHPELKKYIIALPCNLSHKKAAVGNISSGWEKWEDRVSQWMKLAHEKDAEVKFEVWTATELRNKLLKENNSPIVEYWFGEKILNDVWFKRHINVATRVLDDRFNPDDHVELSIESVFDAIVRGPGFIQQISNGFSKISSHGVPSIKFSTPEHTVDMAHFEAATNTWHELVSLQSSFPTDFSRNWNLIPVKKSLQRLMESTGNLETQYASARQKKDIKAGDKNKLEEGLHCLRELKSSCLSLNKLLENQSFLAEAAQFAIVYGPAGAGKSHMLGRIAEQRTINGLPTVLLMGQDFSDYELWEQIGYKLSLKNRTEETVLGVLNAAGERKGVRTLILIDAINEGAGAHYWRQRLLALSEIMIQYPNLAMVLSCREEYIRYALPESLADSVPKFQINGFSSSDEMEQAAIQYLDKKGIARPNTPWLSPEFSNPLFLKCASEAIKKKDETEFPRGLTGISGLMTLYLDALSTRTLTSDADPSQLAISVRQLVKKFAGKMAKDGCDYVVLNDATQLADQCFTGMQPPIGKSWLNVFIETSLFRRDPPPFVEDYDPFNPPPERIRFAFQRFQDHLMGQSLIEDIKPDQMSTAFEEGKPLNFIFNGGKFDKGICYERAGLIESLSTIYPETLGVEFASTLPDWRKFWDNEPLLQEGFAQSCKFRQTDAFSGQTSELFSSLVDDWVDRLGLILDVSMTVEHPWNALYLHSLLMNMDMPERDSYWTRWINLESNEDASQMNRIISWALSSLHKEADIHHLKLASLVLSWSLSSSHMTLRDRATKALTSIFLKHYCIFEFLLEKIDGCDDPYVIERLYAAGFGACCIDQGDKRLNSYSLEVFRRIFADGQPPVALLTRDYALGIVELAKSRGVLSSDVQIDLCYPPFNSTAPDLDITKKEVEQLATSRGGNQILRSASSEWGDFGKYSIPGRVNSFLTTPLIEPKPLSNETRRRIFIKEIINPFSDRLAVLAQYEKQLDPNIRITLCSSKDEMERKEAEQKILVHQKAKNKSREELEALLDAEELEQLSKYFYDEFSHEEYESVKEHQCRLWITRRAYELGWSANLFPHDDGNLVYSRFHNDLERIGKKYQRIALDEIQARLADNFWMLQGWPRQPCVYRYSDEDFRRNVEPTILSTDSRYGSPILTKDYWIFQPTIRLPEVVEENLKEWPFQEDPTTDMGEKLLRKDEQGNRWLVLYEYNHDSLKYLPMQGEHGMRYQEFRFFYCVFLMCGTVEKFVKQICDTQRLDGDFFKPREFTDGPYLREAFWRETWRSEKFSEQYWNAPDACKFAIPVARYDWESHLDKSLPDGFSAEMPQMWFARELGLSLSSENSKMWIDTSNNCVIQIGNSDLHDTAVVMDEQKFNIYCKEFDIEPVWIMIAERSCWPGGHNYKACWRRSTGVVRLNKNSWKEIRWNRDTKR